MNTHHLKIYKVHIHGTAGVGLTLTDIYGETNIDHIIVESSYNTTMSRGGNLLYNCSYSYDSGSNINHVTFTNSAFRYGKNNVDGSGIAIGVLCTANIKIELQNIYLVDNVGKSGGNILINLSGSTNVSILIMNSWIGGTANDGSGGGLCMFGISSALLKIENTHFENNTSYHNGGAVYLALHEGFPAALGLIEFTNCTFTSNKYVYGSTTSHGGVAVHINTFVVADDFQHKIIFFTILFSDCIFKGNFLKKARNTVDLPRAGALFTENVKSIALQNSSFINNSCSGIVGINESLSTAW